MSLKDDNLARIVSHELARLERAKGQMSQSILNTALLYAPYLTGALRNDGRIIRKRGEAYTVRFGSSRVKYARLRHEVNNKNPHTKKYLKRAGDSVKSKGAGAFL